MSSTKKKTTTKSKKIATKRIRTKKIDNTKLANSSNLPSLIEDTSTAFIAGIVAFMVIGVFWFGIDYTVLIGAGLLQVPMGVIIGFIVYKAIIPILTKFFLIELSIEANTLIKQILIFLGPSLTFWILSPPAIY